MKATAFLVALGVAAMLVTGASAAQVPATLCLVLETGHAFLRGRATAEGDRPLPNLDIEILNLESRRMCRTATESDGTYEIPNLPAGTYRFTIRRAFEYFAVDGPQIISPDHAIVTVTLTEGQRLEHFDFRFVRGAAISGTVVDVRGQPVVNIQVRAVNVDGSFEWPGHIIPTAITTERGDFIVRPLLSGRYYVAAEEPTGGPLAPRPGARRQFMLSYFPGTIELSEAKTVTVTPDTPGDARIVIVAAGAVR